MRCVNLALQDISCTSSIFLAHVMHVIGVFVVWFLSTPSVIISVNVFDLEIAVILITG